MKKSKAFEALEKVASQNGISISEVYKEIELAIDVSMASSDSKTQDGWAKMRSKGAKLIPEELIVCVAEKIKLDMAREFID